MAMDLRSLFSPNASGMLNVSHGSNDSFKMSPANFLNISMGTAKDNLQRRSFSPAINKLRTPEISPIIKKKKDKKKDKENDKENVSPFLIHRKTPKLDKEMRYKKISDLRKKRYTIFSVPKTPINSPNPNQNNSNLEKTMSVSVILKELDMQQYEAIFVREEIDLKVFYTLNKKDLNSIGITDDVDIEKILNFISVTTPEKLMSSLSFSLGS